MGGEAVVRLGAGATFSGAAADYFAPSNWPHLDAADLDVGGSGPVVLDVPGATPSQLVIALGKNGVAYLLDRNNLGGIGTGDGTLGEGVQSAPVSTGPIINAAAAYRTASGSYVVFNTIGSGNGCPARPGNVVALKIGASAPPTLSVAWCADPSGKGLAHRDHDGRDGKPRRVDRGGPKATAASSRLTETREPFCSQGEERPSNCASSAVSRFPLPCAAASLSRPTTSWWRSRHSNAIARCQMPNANSR
jgi:hypothetical protein